jgi:glycosyltransferase involved in cell wall biosynthesis
MARRDDIRGERVKIGYIAFQYPQLSETFISDEIAELVRRGVDVTVFTLDPPGPRDALVKEVTAAAPTVDCSLPASNLRRLKLFVRLFPLAARRPVAFARAVATAGFSFRKIACLNFLQAGRVALYLKGRDVGLLHGGFADQPATVAMFAAALCGIPFSFAAHSGRDTRRCTTLLGSKIKRSAFVRPVSDFVGNSLRERFGFGEKLVTIRCGIDSRDFAGGERGDGAFKVVTVGRLVREKGISYLLRAAYALKQKRLAVSYRVIGAGPVRDEILALSAALGLDRDVEFLGALSRSAVIAVLREASLFVLPCVGTPEGNMDGLPIAILEAMASGVPVVSTNISGIPEAVEAGAGILVPPGDAEALAGAIEEVYDDSRNGGDGFPAGPRIVEEKFDIEKNVAALARAMKEVASLC